MAVICWTGEYSFCKMCILRKVVVILTVLFGVIGFSFGDSPKNCDLVSKDFERIVKLSHLKILENPETGDICDVSCCTRETERELYKYNQQSLNRYLKNSISKVGNIIETRAKKFDDCFREMMNSSKMEFHEMFERTYGKIYLKNSDVFSDFFHELEIYYKKGTIRLSESMDTFFGILYQRMFTVINAQYTFDDKYLTCVAENMPEMKPFGDVPKKLGMQLRRSFVATRTFFKSLIRGVEVANKMTTLNIENDCYRESMKMRFCGICRGETHSGPCSNYCTNTTKYCLAHHSELSTHWDNFVDAIDKVGDRLLGPYNIEQVVEPLNIKISEAIMTFQDSGANVSKKIYTKCGKPTFNRSRRKAEYKNSSEDNPNMEIKTEPMKMPGKKKHKKVEQIERSTLEKIILDIKQKIKETKQFWLQLPYQFCNNLSLSFNITDRDECYNGTMGIDGDEYAKNIAGTSAIVNEQLYILTDLTDKLKKAYQGQEVEMVDDTEEILAGSGSGSGDFSIETTEYEPKVRIHEEEEEEFFTTVLSPSSTRAPEVGRPASTASTTTMSLTRALLQYILPMVLVWFGGAITNLL